MRDLSRLLERFEAQKRGEERVSQEEHDRVLQDIGSSSRDIFGLPINCTFTEAQAVVDRVKLTVRSECVLLTRWLTQFLTHALLLIRRTSTQMRTRRSNSLWR